MDLSDGDNSWSIYGLPFAAADNDCLLKLGFDADGSRMLKALDCLDVLLKSV